MDDHRLGFLIPSSIIAGVITLLLTAGLYLTRGGSLLFSPGPLAQKSGAPIQGVASHAELSGNCAACHGKLLDNSTMDQNCETCHKDILKQQGDPATLHGNLAKKNGGLDCRSCHQEHGGPLTDLSKADVVHDWFGYSLEGHQKKANGAGFECKDCHTQDITGFEAAACSQCHQQVGDVNLEEHIQAYGENCLACHDGVDRYGKHFDHNQFAFKLDGAHAGAACTDCHQNARQPDDFKKAPSECNTCHAQDNPHTDKLGTDCASCHTTENWQPTSFNHDLTGYKLEGKHAEAACSDCHKNNVYQSTPKDCATCHKGDDAHQGQNGTDCALCHTSESWDQTKPLDHNTFAFKLTGAHVNVACSSCHVNNVYKGTPKNCEDCHRKDSPHRSPYYVKCSMCHSTTNW